MIPLYGFRKRKFPFVVFSLWAAFLLALIAYFIHTTHSSSYKNAAENSMNEAKILANSLDAALRRVSSLTEWVHYVLEEHQEIHHYARELAVLCNNFPELADFAVYNQDLDLIAAVRPQSCLDKPDLSTLFATASTELAFSETLTCQHGDHLALVAYKVVNDPSGNQFFITASIDLSFYEAFFALLSVGEHGMVSFRRSDTSQLVVRWPTSATRINNLAPDIPPQLAINQGVSEGVVRYVGGTDGVERIFAFRQLDRFPFYALVGRETGDIFKAWIDYSIIAGLAALLLLATSALFLIKLENSLNFKNILINELMHRTNNSLQVVLSLIQLSMYSKPEPGKDDQRLPQLLSRIRSLGLAQGLLNTDCSTVPLGALLQAVCAKFRMNDSNLRLVVEPAGVALLLDYAAPLTLICNELLELAGHNQHQPQISIEANLSNQELQFIFGCACACAPNADSLELIEPLCSHQLGGTFSITSLDPFECAMRIPLGAYFNRIRKNQP